MLFLPRYSHSETSPNVVFCSFTILLESVLLGSTFSISLPAIIAWLIAGKRQSKPLSLFYDLIKFDTLLQFDCYSRRCIDIHTMRYMVFTMYWTTNVHKSHCIAKCYRPINVQLEIDDSFAKTTERFANSNTHTWPVQMTFGVQRQWIHRRWRRRNCRRMDGLSQLSVSKAIDAFIARKCVFQGFSSVLNVVNKLATAREFSSNHSISNVSNECPTPNKVYFLMI